jgi:hypothetical protein
LRTSSPARRGTRSPRPSVIMPSSSSLDTVGVMLAGSVQPEVATAEKADHRSRLSLAAERQHGSLAQRRR